MLKQSSCFEGVVLVALVTELTEKGIVSDKDIKMTGKVTWAGKSSMEMTMDLDQVHANR